MLCISQLSHHPRSPLSGLSVWQRPQRLAAADYPTLNLASRRPQFAARRHERVGFAPAGCTGRAAATVVKAVVSSGADTEKVVTARVTIEVFLSSLGVDHVRDGVSYLYGETLLLELVSAGLDPKTGLEKETVKAIAQKVSVDKTLVNYEAEFVVPEDFGEVGGVFVENEHHMEVYVHGVMLDGFLNGPQHVTCNSWVQSKSTDNPAKRVFFMDKCYLPPDTPNGLKRLREEELASLRGTGEGERKSGDRVYDYDTYNDLGNPDKADLARPVLGGKEHPYPRRCRTGRPQYESDHLSETRSRSSSVYVPRDESFAEVKQLTFKTKSVYSFLHGVVPWLESIDADAAFPYFSAIDSLFNENEGINVPKPNQAKAGFFRNFFGRLFKSVKDSVLHFDVPALFGRDKFAWFRDEEFARQTLAGLNPCSLRLVTEWPLKSKLDPQIYGPPESAITTEMIERQIKGFMTVNEAVKNKKLFILDYHDSFLPYVHKVREIKGTTLYGSRTVLFLTPEGTLMPLAIELTRPKSQTKPQWKQAFTPSSDSTACWLWRIAKAHVLAHDSGYHQLVSHWLRTHCCVEPYIIAMHRQLSSMHPIFRLLRPHFRYTMEINAMARQTLINADGIIEKTFSPRKYSMEISSAIYGNEWRFDKEALPADLINRGLAVEDPNAPHGVSLVIEDYPFANDGLILFDSIREWVTDYVNHYYPEASLVESDQELQAWWTEIRTVGHGDKKDEPWWPVLKTPKDLVHTLTTIIWVCSGHHAAVNFGQYHFAGYFPNRPTIARTNMPNEEPSDELWKFFLNKPEDVLLKCFPSKTQATKVMITLDVLSTHSPDEEYLGDKLEPSWDKDPIVKAAFERFSGRLKELEGTVDARNADPSLKNRHGAGVVPYELLKPFSKPGVTGMGVPNSISV